MSPFLNAQSADPTDPAPMLIHADWLEEQGDQVGAEVLRGLAAAGIPSPAALALAVGSASPMGIFSGLDVHDLVEATWIGEGDGWGGSLGPGYGDGHREWFSAGEGVGDGEADGVGVGSGESFEADGGGDGQGEFPDDEPPG